MKKAGNLSAQYVETSAPPWPSYTANNDAFVSKFKIELCASYKNTIEMLMLTLIILSILHFKLYLLTIPPALHGTCTHLQILAAFIGGVFVRFRLCKISTHFKEVFTKKINEKKLERLLRKNKLQRNLWKIKIKIYNLGFLYLPEM